MEALVTINIPQCKAGVRTAIKEALHEHFQGFTLGNVLFFFFFFCRPGIYHDLMQAHKFTVVMATAVYILLDGNASMALSHVDSALSRQQKVVLPKLHQTLDKTYSDIKHGHWATQLPHLGSAAPDSSIQTTPHNTDCEILV